MSQGQDEREQPDAGVKTVAFFDRTYNEALELTREARDYIAGRSRNEDRKLEPEDRLVASCEEMRLTARMTQVMAWLLLQKAVHNGEISRSEAADSANRLSGQKVCLDSLVNDDSELPPRLNELMHRSRNLYERVQRLDAMLKH